MCELFRIRRTRGTAKTENFEEDLAEPFGIGMSQIFEYRKDGL